MTRFRRFAGAMAITFFAALPPCSFASTFSTDFTDVWWNPDESGWGVTVTQNSDLLFLTFFVYGADSKPYWVTAAAPYVGTNAMGSLMFSGDLYETNGPWLGGPFNTTSVNYHKVGTATFIGQYIESGQLSYTVNGTTVNKQIQRQLLRNENLTGSYLGGSIQTDYNCTNPAYNGTTEDTLNMTIQQTGQEISVAWTAVGSTTSCTIQGTYSQAGKMGDIVASGVCNGASASFHIYEIESRQTGFGARYAIQFSAQGQSCAANGTFAGVKRG
jgi:hypothetical protein